METIGNKGWLDKLNRFNSTVLMPAVFFTFILFNTVINLWLDEKVETLQNLLVIMVLGIVICNFILKPKALLVPWIKTNYFIVIYLAIRIASFINSGFDYSVARTIFFEAFFLIGITSITINKKAIKNIYIYAFLAIELMLTLPCLIIYYIGDGFSNTAMKFLSEHTYYMKANTTAIFSNSNTAGIMAAIAVILTLIIYRNKWTVKAKVLAGGFIIYNIFFLITQSTRSAEIGLVAIVLASMFKMIFKKVNKKTLCYLSLALCILFVGVSYSFIGYHVETNQVTLNENELSISVLSSGRYGIWKECFIEQKNHILIGAGNLTLEQKKREETFTSANGYSYEMRRGAKFGPHNGYIGMISGAGWLGFLMFMAILFQRIRRAKVLNKGNWYLAIVFIFAINLFESLFILNRFFTCFYLFLILEMDEEDGELLEGEL